MRFLLGRNVAGLIAAMLLVSGCGGSQGQMAGVGVDPSSAAHNTHGLKSATSGDLIYATGGCGGICVLSYPDGSVVASIHPGGNLGGACVDSAGNVFVTNWTQVLEYSHAGTSPIATLSLPGNQAASCSVDPMSNNLAVTFVATKGGDVAVFNNEGGTPTVFSSKIDSLYCGYDNAGNLFVDGVTSKGFAAISELPSGQSIFTPLSINGNLGAPGQLQWDGSYLTWESRAIDKKPGSISRLTVSGSAVTVVSTGSLKGKVNISTLSWIYNGQILMPYSTRGQRSNKIGIWPYPHAGKRASVIKFQNAKTWNIQGLTVSSGSK